MGVPPFYLENLNDVDTACRRSCLTSLVLVHCLQVLPGKLGLSVSNRQLAQVHEG